MPKRERGKLKAFVLMPFEEEFDVIFDEIIKPTLEAVGFIVNHADKFLNQQSILKDIIQGIEEANLVVADLTALNPNVMYELGISHSLGKPTVMISQSIDDVPFDVKTYRVIEYSTRFDKMPKLAKKLKEIGKKHKIKEISFSNPVSDYKTRKRRG